jgi:hypothetical protein
MHRRPLAFAGLLTGAVDLLNQAQAHVWGVVLNRVKARGGDGYYYYYGHSRDRGEPRAPTSAEEIRAAASLPPQAANGANGTARHRRDYAENPKSGTLSHTVAARTEDGHTVTYLVSVLLR